MSGLASPSSSAWALVNGIPLESIDWAKFASRGMWSLVAYVVVVLVLVVSRRGARNLVEVSQLAGREMGRAEMLRSALHDRVLPILDEMTRLARRQEPHRIPPVLDEVKAPARPDDRDPGELLTELASWAEREAADIRDMLCTDDLGWAGLFAELGRVTAAAKGRGFLAVDLAVVGPGPAIAAVVSQALLGAVGEAIRNAEAHAGARRLTVYAECVDATLQVIVSDDGCGFDEARIRADAHGVRRSIRESLESIGCHAELDSGIGRGTRWTSVVPLSG